MAQKNKSRKLYIDYTLVVILIGAFVFAGGFGLCLQMSRTNASEMAEKSARDKLDLLHMYIEGQLNAVEHVSYAICGTDNRDYVVFDDAHYSEVNFRDQFQAVLKVEPLISGLAVAFGYPYPGLEQGKYGRALYCANNGGHGMDVIKISDNYDYTLKEWYSVPMSSGRAYWSNPFRETSNGDIVTSFSLPIINKDHNKTLGVIVIDISMDRFQNKCKEILPYRNSKTLIIDENFRLICHPDTTKLLMGIDAGDGNEYYSGLKESIIASDNGCVTLDDGNSKSLLYFEKIPRTRWTICIEVPEEEIFSKSDKLGLRMLLIAILSLLLMTVCLRYLYRKIVRTTIANADMERDLNIATKVQMSRLPKEYPPFPDRRDIDVCGFIKTAKMVGGDLYDYIIRDEKLFFCIGDVSGKGVPASLFMFLVTTMFHNIAKSADSTDEIASKLNDVMASENKDCSFCTFFVGILDLKTGVLEYCNAGHETPVVVSFDSEGCKSTSLLDIKSNVALGIIEGFPFVSQKRELQPGDIFFFYTDGVTEAEGAGKSLFGIEATVDAVGNVCGKDTPLVDMLNGVYEAIRHHTAGVEQNDDITMLMFRYKG